MKRSTTAGTVQSYVENFANYVTGRLQITDTYLVFDRYYQHSTKETTRTSRAGKDASRRHQLSMATPLPPQKVCLTVTHNKIQLISLICDYLVEHPNIIPPGRTLLVTGAKPTPLEISGGGVTERMQLKTTHEEADVIVVQQAIRLASFGKQSIHIVADDTDIFTLLLHYFKAQNLTCNLLMIATSPSRTSVDIKATAEKHPDIIDNILAAHVLSGCDTVSSLWGVGKAKIIKVLKTGKKLETLGQIEAPLDDVIAECTSFIACCYGEPKETDMTSLQYKVWLNKMSNQKLNAAPKLMVLPPTRESFQEHVKRAHLQAATWRSALASEPPALNAVHYGWSMKTGSNILEPVGLPPDVSPAPVDVLKMIKCGCASSHPCSSARCSCSSARLSCSEFCACRGNEDCRNVDTMNASNAEDDQQDLNEDDHLAPLD